MKRRPHICGAIKKRSRLKFQLCMARRASPLCLALCCVFVFAAPRSLRADKPKAQSGVAPEAQTAKAKGYFREGMEAFSAREFRKAIRLFNLASRTVPSADLTYNIARAHEELREYEQAATAYGEYLRDRVDPPDEDAVRTRIKELRRLMKVQQKQAKRDDEDGIVKVRLKPELQDARGSLGETSLSFAEDASLKLKPGSYALRVEHPDYLPALAKVKVDGSSDFTAYADMERRTRYTARRGKPRWTWLVTGLAVASLGGATFAGIKAARADNRGDEAQKDRWARVSDGLLGASVVLGVGAVVTYFIERRSKTEDELR